MLRSFARTFASCGVFLLVPLLVQAQALSFSVGTATAAPGEKSTGYLEVPAGVDAATNIPVIIINGEKRGPVLALVSGAHGTEYTSIIAIEKLINLLDPSQIAGTVILVPLVNIQSFEQKVPHVNPIDNKSMNRFYPGKADGTQTERASFLITKQVVDRCDYLIDYHGGDLDESLRPYAYWALLARRPKTVYPKRWSSPLDSITLLYGATVLPTSAPLAISTAPLLLAANLPSSWKLAMQVSSNRMTSPSSSTERSTPCALSKCFQETLGPSRIPSGWTESWMSCPTALAFGTRL
jgi:hypothetical protein